VCLTKNGTVFHVQLYYLCMYFQLTKSICNIRLDYSGFLRLGVCEYLYRQSFFKASYRPNGMKWTLGHSIKDIEY